MFGLVQHYNEDCMHHNSSRRRQGRMAGPNDEHAMHAVVSTQQCANDGQAIIGRNEHRVKRQKHVMSSVSTTLRFHQETDTRFRPHVPAVGALIRHEGRRVRRSAKRARGTTRALGTRGGRCARVFCSQPSCACACGSTPCDCSARHMTSRRHHLLTHHLLECTRALCGSGALGTLCSMRQR